jgi:hypothetical protein
MVWKHSNKGVHPKR